MKTWSITQARANIAEVFEAALRKEPQKIERRNSEPVIVIPESMWKRIEDAYPTFADLVLDLPVDDEDRPDEYWLQHQARTLGMSVDDYVRRLIREKRHQEQAKELPSQAFRRHFGPEHGVDLPERARVGYRAVGLGDDEGA